MVKNKKILITGAGAQLAVYFKRSAASQSLDVTAFSSPELDVTRADLLQKTVANVKPDIILNCAAYNLIDQAEADPQMAMAVNAQAPEHLAGLCRKQRILLVHYSTAHVFDGNKQQPYVESDPVAPVNVYGRSKLAGEEAIRQQLDQALILRLSWMFGRGKNCFLTKVAQWAGKSPALKISTDEISVPAYSQDIVDATLAALRKGLTGLFHLTSHGSCSRYEYVKFYCQKMGLRNELVPVLAESFHLPARRPLYTCMANGKIEKALGLTLPHWQDGLTRFTEQLKKGSF